MKEINTILLTGVEGYMGWPTFLKMGKRYTNSLIVGVDNHNRRKWVQEVGSLSAIPIVAMDRRVAAAKGAGYDNLEFVEGDLSSPECVRGLIQKYQPDVIVHMAAQPSAPYSHMNWEMANYTQDLNVRMTRNLLWALREANLIQTHYIETTTTGIYGAPNFDIPEGDVHVSGSDGRSQMLPFPNMASSWYHVTKGFNATNMRLMNFQTKLPVTDIRTSIVFGTETDETRSDEAFATRFDFDFYFGTLFNRWCAMAVCGVPLTIYGSGNQIKPFISLEDAAQSIVNAVGQDNDGEYRIVNQLTFSIRIKDMARIITSAAGKLLGKDVEVSFIPNPRVEVEDYEYNFANKRFLRLLGKERGQTMEEVIPEVISTLREHEDILQANKKCFMK